MKNLSDILLEKLNLNDRSSIINSDNDTIYLLRMSSFEHEIQKNSLFYAEYENNFFYVLNFEQIKKIFQSPDFYGYLKLKEIPENFNTVKEFKQMVKTKEYEDFESINLLDIFNKHNSK